MKPKQIPRSIRLWLTLLGIWGGTCATIVLFALWLIGFDTALYILVAYALGVWGLWYALGKKYGNALEEWGLITPKKEKGKQ